MEVSTKVDKHSHIKNWIKLWNGGMQLTEKEQTFFGELLYRYMNLMDKGIKEPYLGELVFSTKSMGEVKAKLGLTKQGLTNYKMSLRNKGVIMKNDEGIWYIPEILVPKTRITFNFKYGEGN